MQKLRKFPKIPETRQRKRFYEFGPFRMDPVKRLLLRDGEPVSLTPKAFEILLALVENRGEVLVKEELIQSIWPDTVVEEGNLNRNISTLRKVLGESPNDHRYIVTVPGRGYRFVADVRGVWDENGRPAGQETTGPQIVEGAQGAVQAEPAVSAPSSSVAGPALRGLPSTSVWLGIGLLVGLVALVVLFIFILPKRSKPLLNETDQVLLSDFVNTTGDPAFDETLKEAISVQLAQSPFLNLLSDARIRATLELMTKPVDTKLTPEVARDLCQRAGGKAYIRGSIATLGSQYVVGLKAINCQTGDSLAHEQVTAESKEHVLKALDRAATKVRERLGESLTTLHKFDTPLEQATTPSLEALKAFSLGRKAQDKKGDAAAIPFFKRAVELDPNFALAFDALGVTYSNLNEHGLASESMTKAYELRDRASEREKFRIIANFSQLVTGELEKADQICELWAQAYPRDDYPHNLLGVNYEFLGQYEKAVAETLEAIRLNPDAAVLYSNLMEDYAALNRFDEAKATYRQALERKRDHPFLHADLYGVAFLQRDMAEMERQVAWAAGQPGAEDWLLSLESDTNAFFGHLGKAREFSRRAVQSARRGDEKETAALWQINAALREAEFGNFERARKETAAALAGASTRDVQILAALALARAGDSAPAQKMGDDLAKRFPLNTVLNAYWLPTIRAAIEINRGNPSKAIEILNAAAPYELGAPNPEIEDGRFLYPVYIRGQAYLLSRRGSEAVTEFQKILDHPGLVENCPLGALAHLGLARAYAFEGDTAKSRAAYLDFFGLWKGADPNIPVLKQAKAEYVKLRALLRRLESAQ